MALFKEQEVLASHMLSDRSHPPDFLPLINPTSGPASICILWFYGQDVRLSSYITPNKLELRCWSSVVLSSTKHFKPSSSNLAVKCVRGELVTCVSHLKTSWDGFRWVRSIKLFGFFSVFAADLYTPWFVAYCSYPLLFAAAFGVSIQNCSACLFAWREGKYTRVH